MKRASSVEAKTEAGPAATGSTPRRPVTPTGAVVPIAAPTTRPAPAARAVRGALRRVMVALLSAPVHVYRYAISPLLPPSCRFYPSCSSYALEALQRHGPLAGGWLAIGRVCRCHPWNDGGVDPVPETFSLRARASRWPAALRGDPPARTD